MKITGYKIREKLNELKLDKDLMASGFNDSLYVFEGEEKENPWELATQLQSLEYKIAALQMSQTEYNLRVQVRVAGELMTLCEAIKRRGGASRMESLWRRTSDGLSGSIGGRYFQDDRIKDTDKIYATPSMSSTEVAEEVKLAAKYVAAIGAAIAEGNTEEIDIPGMDESLFE